MVTPPRPSDRPTGPRAGHAAVAAGLVAAAALLTACGTVHDGAPTGPLATDGPRATAPATPAPSSPTPVASPTATATPAATPAVTATPVPTVSGRIVPTPIMRRLVLPTTGTGPVGAVSGTVRSGLNRCLYVTTDAGQRFAVAGSLSTALRTALASRVAATDRVGADATSAPLAPGRTVRLVAYGTVSTGPSICGSRWTFTVTRGSIG